MGLAINTADGKVVVVENAHELYPDICKNRYDGISLEVSGQVIKQKGNVSWVEPTSLKALY